MSERLRAQIEQLREREQQRLSEHYKLPYDRIGQQVRSAYLKALADVLALLPEADPPVVRPLLETLDLKAMAADVEFCLWDTREGEQDRIETLVRFGRAVADIVGRNSRAYWEGHLKALHDKQVALARPLSETEAEQIIERLMNEAAKLRMRAHDDKRADDQQYHAYRFGAFADALAALRAAPRSKAQQDVIELPDKHPLRIRAEKAEAELAALRVALSRPQDTETQEHPAVEAIRQFMSVWPDAEKQINGAIALQRLRAGHDTYTGPSLVPQLERFEAILKASPRITG